MRVEVIMPRMGQSMEEGTILNWLQPLGAVVKRGDPLIEIESDKATVEIEAFATGRLAEILVQPGDAAPIGAILAYIEVEERAIRPREPVLPTTPVQNVGQPEARRPSVVSPVARRVAQEHGFDPATLAGTGPGGRVTKEDVQTAVTASIDTAQASSALSLKPGRLDISPLARRLARENNIDLRLIVGSAPNGRIIKRDIVSMLAAPDTAVLAAPSLPNAGQPGGVVRMPLSRLQRIAAKRMVESKQQIPHFYLTLDVRMERSLLLRESLNRRGKRVSINDLVLKATALALAAYPSLNAVYEGNDLLLNEAVNLAFAVAVGDKTRSEGLTTPVIHGCQALTLVEIAGRAGELAAKARDSKLTPDQLSGATFTVSNLGMFGIRQFQAIINPPQVAILAVGALQKLAVFDDQDRVTPAQQMTVTLSADHRATDGAEAAGFLATFKEVIEDAFVLAE